MTFPKWQMHRGYWKSGVRENTMEAFEKAFEQGIDMVEFDVQVSLDGIPHVYHDWTLKRFFHIDKRVTRLKSEELSGLNIPTLFDVLKNKRVPKAVNIEIKSIDLLCLNLTRRVCKVIAGSKTSKKVMISSFNPMVLYWAKRFLPEITRAQIIGDPDALMAPSFRISMALGKPDYINCSYQLIDEKVTRERLLSFGKPLMVWTVNDTQKAKTYLQRGAKSIISDVLPSS